MKKITDNTLVKVKVPKHLYEAIQKKLALKEEEEMKKSHTEMKKPEMHKGGEEGLNEDMDIINALKNVDIETVMMILTAGGVTGLAKFISDKIKSGGSNISGITGAEHG